MRPSLLSPLFKSIGTLKGLGPRLQPLYERLCGPTLLDLLWHRPNGIIDRRYSPWLRDAEKDRIATLTVTVQSIEKPRRPKLPTRVLTHDGTENLTLTYFHAKGDYLHTLYPLGTKVVVSGLLERYHGQWVMHHPDYVTTENSRQDIPALQPTYPLTQGVTQKTLCRLMAQAITQLPVLPEWNDPHLLVREGWLSWKDSVLALHTPTGNHEQSIKARCRLAYDEMLADQLALTLIRKHHQRAQGKAHKGTGQWIQALRATLPFCLTPAQEKAFQDITADMTSDQAMIRLLQGDVGSGKTIVALMAMLQAVESGGQAALMAPTEILAKQHYAKLSAFLAPMKISLALVVGRGREAGSKKAQERAETLNRLAEGTLSLVVGTHALFQDDVRFSNLALVVVDEQHRFGVEQRLALTQKGKGVDILVTTATPIPRTLTLTAYGDMDVSRMLEKPAGRRPIDTRVIDSARLDAVIAGIHRHLSTGQQVYWVCPLVDESEESDLAAATTRAALLQSMLDGYTVGLIHGRMKTDEKDHIMASFHTGALHVLVATTVIEVGVDVPNATVMVIEHAERFGLAQLHQLRGRVGRGALESRCLLLYQSPLSPMAKARLAMMRDTEDGFRIAEEDLRLRGPGEILGTKQSGLTNYRLADLSLDNDLLAMAADDARVILNKDPSLSSPRGEALRTLLYLFSKDKAITFLRSG